MFNKLKAKRKAGFTLVEILVVILIIGLLFVFLVPKIDSATDKARETGIKTDFRSYQTAFEAVAREHSGLGVNAIATEAAVINLINGYLDPALKIGAATDASNGVGYDVAKKDPWNNSYIFAYTSEADSNDGFVSIRTMGKDMRNTYNHSLMGGIGYFEFTADGVLNADADAFDKSLECARKNNVDESADGSNIDDYVLGTWYIDGVIVSATAGFTTNLRTTDIVN